MLKFLSRFMWLPLLLSYSLVYALQRGISVFLKAKEFPSELIWVFTLYSFAKIVWDPIIGYFADKVKLKTLMLIATLGGSACLFLAPHNLWIFFGIGWAMASTLVKVASYSAPLKDRDSGEIYQLAGLSMGKYIGPALWLTLSMAFILQMGWQYLFYFSAATFLICGLIATYGVSGVAKYELTWGKVFELLKEKKVWLLGAVCFVLSLLVYGFFSNIFPALIKGAGLSKGLAATYFCVALWAACALRWLWAWLGETFGYIKALVTSMVLATVGLFSPPMAMLALCTLGLSGFTPNVYRLMKDVAGKERVGTLVGITFLFFSAGAGLAPHIVRWI